MDRKTFTDTRIDPALLTDTDSPYRNRLLVAMPGMQESAFSKSVIYICAHSESGAMGIVINRQLPDIGFGELLEQLHLPRSQMKIDPVVHFGGPVETGRGFVLHSGDFIREDTVRINENTGDGICITGTIDILKAMAEGQGPRRSIFALGYAGWGPGQLEAEMQANTWLTVDATADLIFSLDLNRKWERALNTLGASSLSLSAEAGHA